MSARSEAKERRPKAGHEAEQAGRRSRILEHVFGLHTRSRRVISEHRHRRKLRDREVSDRSRRGLDWTNFFLADVQLSFGSFLAFYLADLGWSKQNVGLALTVGGLAAVAAQIPGGALADACVGSEHWRRRGSRSLPPPRSFWRCGRVSRGCSLPRFFTARARASSAQRSPLSASVSPAGMECRRVSAEIIASPAAAMP